MRKLLLLCFLFLLNILSVGAEESNLQRISKPTIANKMIKSFKEKRSVIENENLFTFSHNQWKATGGNKKYSVLSQKSSESKIGLLPTKAVVENPSGNFEREFDYDEYGNITLRIDENEGIKEYYEWIQLPNGKFTASKERLEYIYGVFILILDVVYDYSEEGILIGLHAKTASGYVGDLVTPEDYEALDWEIQEDWVFETNAEGIRTGINGISSVNDIRFDEKGRVSFVSVEEEYETVEYTYTWGENYLIGYEANYSDDEQQVSMVCSNIELVYNEHLFDPYAIAPHVQLDVEDFEKPMELIYYNASANIREGIYVSQIKFEAVIDEESECYEENIYVVVENAAYFLQGHTLEKKDEFGSFEWSLMIATGIGSTNKILGLYHYEEYDANRNLINLIVGELNEYTLKVSFTQKKTFYESERPIKADFYRGDNKENLVYYETEIYTVWKDGQVSKICDHATLQNVNLYLIEGNLYIESEEVVDSLTIYAINGNIIGSYQNIDGLIALPKGVSIVKINTEKGSLVQKIIN